MSDSYEYKYGFETIIESDTIPKGLNEDILRMISKKKNEPDWILDYRLKAFRHWQTLIEPMQSENKWAQIKYPPISFQDLTYYSAPKQKKDPKTSLSEIDPELIKTFERLGIPLSEQKRISGVAMDVVFDSVSIATTHNEELEKAGVIFCSISEAIHKHPELVKKYFGSVVPYTDNYYAALNAAVFSDGSFVYIPKNTRCPIDLSTYFRINAKENRSV